MTLSEFAKIFSAKSFDSSSVAGILVSFIFLVAFVYVNIVLNVVAIIIIHQTITTVAITHANNQHHQLVFQEPPVTKQVNSISDNTTPGTVINTINNTPNNLFPIGTSVFVTNIDTHNTKIVILIATATYLDCVEPTIAFIKGLEAIYNLFLSIKNIIKKMIKILYKYNFNQLYYLNYGHSLLFLCFNKKI